MAIFLGKTPIDFRRTSVSYQKQLTPLSASELINDVPFITPTSLSEKIAEVNELIEQLNKKLIVHESEAEASLYKKVDKTFFKYYNEEAWDEATLSDTVYTSIPDGFICICETDLDLSYMNEEESIIKDTYFYPTNGKLLFPDTISFSDGVLNIDRSCTFNSSTGVFTITGVYDEETEEEVEVEAVKYNSSTGLLTLPEMSLFSDGVLTLDKSSTYDSTTKILQMVEKTVTKGNGTSTTTSSASFESNILTFGSDSEFSDGTFILSENNSFSDNILTISGGSSTTVVSTGRSSFTSDSGLLSLDSKNTFSTSGELDLDSTNEYVQLEQLLRLL